MMRNDKNSSLFSERTSNPEGERGGRGVYRQPLPQSNMKIIDMRGAREDENQKKYDHENESEKPHQKKEKRKKHKKEKKKKLKKESSDSSGEEEENEEESEENDDEGGGDERKLKKRKKEKKEKREKKEKGKFNPFLQIFAESISDTTREFRTQI